MEAQQLDDDVVDQVRVGRERRPDHFLSEVTVPADGPAGLRVLQNFLTQPGWREILFLAEGAAARQSHASDLGGFSYPHPDYDDFTGVNVFDGGDNTVNLSEPAFDRLMLRALRTLIGEAAEVGDSATRSEWWARLLACADELEQRERLR